MDVDIAIIGGGIAGLSCAAFIGDEASVVVLEMEPTLGYHATGRSAALYTECYGADVIRRLAIASKPFLTDGDTPLLSDRGVMFTSPVGSEPILRNLFDRFTPLVPDLEMLTPAEVESTCPIFPADKVSGGVFERGAHDIDVDALQTRFAKIARAGGVTTMASTPVTGIERTPHAWRISTATGIEITASTIVDAAGAWGDEIASMAGVAPLGLTPLARSVFTFDPSADPRSWPMVIDAEEDWYVKPEGPNMLGSAASEIPSPAADIRAEELDVALGIERVNEASNLSIRSVKNTWAGLRTFTPDRVPAVGWANEDPSFFWLVGQGGYGIKTSPALGDLAASLILGRPVPDVVSSAGVDVNDLAPARFFEPAV